MTNPIDLLLTILAALGGFLVAKATANKTNAEGQSISVKAFQDLSKSVQELLDDKANIQRELAELRDAGTKKDSRIAQLEEENAELREKVATLETEVEELRKRRKATR